MKKIKVFKLSPGQRDLCSSDVLPAEGSGLEKVQALGIEWGGCVEDDPMFRHVKMPEEEEEPTATAATCEVTDCTQAAVMDGGSGHETSE